VGDDVRRRSKSPERSGLFVFWRPLPIGMRVDSLPIAPDAVLDFLERNE